MNVFRELLAEESAKQAAIPAERCAKELACQKEFYTKDIAALKDAQKQQSVTLDQIIDKIDNINNVGKNGNETAPTIRAGQESIRIVGKNDHQSVMFGTKRGPICVSLKGGSKTATDLVQWLHKVELLAPLEDGES